VYIAASPVSGLDTGPVTVPEKTTELSDAFLTVKDEHDMSIEARLTLAGRKPRELRRISVFAGKTNAGNNINKANIAGLIVRLIV
jgi:hypothetical protein